jgi:L-amino acid N-acyltransferase YncA
MQINEIEHLPPITQIEIFNPETIIDCPEVLIQASTIFSEGIMHVSGIYLRPNIEKSLANYQLVPIENGKQTFALWNSESNPDVKHFMCVERADSQLNAVVIGKFLKEGSESDKKTRMHTNWVVSQTFKENYPEDAKGAASRIYQYLICLANDSDVDYLSAGIVSLNTASIRLFSKFGFKKIPNTEKMAKSGMFILNNVFTPRLELTGINIHGKIITPATLDYYWLPLKENLAEYGY